MMVIPSFVLRMSVRLSVHIWIFMSVCLGSVYGDVTTDYMTSSCTTISAALSGSRRVESGTAMTYDNNMNCTYVITTTSNRYKIKAIFRTFDLESPVSGTCVDYLNIYDGGSTSATLLNASPLCGFTNPSDILSTGSQLTFLFVSDSSATGYGLDILFSEYAPSPCNSDEFGCTNGVCIQGALACNNYDECGDNSDESSCTLDNLLGVSNAGNVALIAGLTVGLSVAIIIGVLVGVKVYREYRWRKFLRDPMPALQKWEKLDNYPVTHAYYKQGYKNIGYKNIDVAIPTPDLFGKDYGGTQSRVNIEDRSTTSGSINGTGSESSLDKSKLNLGITPGSSKS